MRSIRVLPLVFVAFACGSKNNTKNPDAPAIGDAPIDNPPPPPGCDYGELNDKGNDYNATPPGVAEQTMVGFTTKSVFCGKINNGHFDTMSMAVDIDSYIFTAINDGDIMITLTAPGAEALTGGFGFTLYDPNQMQGVAAGTFTYDHATAIASIPAGIYELDLEAYNAADIAAPIDYKINVTTDTPAARCMQIATAANYTEAHDLAGNNGNDMINISYAATPTNSFTVSTTDAPEPSALTIDSAMSYRVSGNSANVNPPDDYMDRDTYAIKTGATTNQISLRLNWPGMTSDLDVYLFDENTVNEVGSSTSVGNDGSAAMGGEFTTFAVKPNTNYWLWVGQYDVDPTAGTPTAVTYDVSACGEVFTP